MPFLNVKCEKCGKVVKLERASRFGDKELRKYSCGHSFVGELLAKVSEQEMDFVSLDGRRPYPFQNKSIQFAVDSDVRCLIGHQMGLGKTIIALLTLKARAEQLTPCLIICKSSLKEQWFREVIRWVGDKYCPQIIETGKDILIPEFKVYIVSYDLLRRLPKDFFDKVNLKYIIIDETQQIKNTESQRTKQVMKVTNGIPHIMGLSGTYIKNHMGEAFPILNILKPDIFPRYAPFLWEWCDTYDNGWAVKVGGLKRHKVAEFKELTENFVLRYTREEVLPELPKVNRMFRFNELGSQVEDAYRDTFRQFQEDYYETGMNGFEASSNILAYLTKMRHLVGLSKIEPTLEFIQEFLEDNDRKMVVFVHHKDVHSILVNRSAAICKELEISEPLSFTAELNMEQRSECIDTFWKNGHRLMIASTLAAGEGLNLQCCSDAVLLERQWNPANEEQAECRFIRIGQEASQVNVTYPIATGTVDEFFSEIVEQKREICNRSMDGNESTVRWDESSLMKELAEVLARKGGAKWGW